MDHGVFLLVDFSKAYDSVFHSDLEAFFCFIAHPPMMIALLMSMFRAPLVFSVGWGIVPEVQLRHRVRNQTRRPSVSCYFRHGVLCLGTHDPAHLS